MFIVARRLSLWMQDTFFLVDTVDRMVYFDESKRVLREHFDKLREHFDKLNVTPQRSAQCGTSASVWCRQRTDPLENFRNS